jgi:hypothetical protein
MWDDDEKRRKDDDAINGLLVGAVFAGVFALVYSLIKNALRYPVAAGMIILGLYGFSQYTAWQTAAAAESVIITASSGSTGCPANNIRLVIANGKADQDILSIRVGLNGFKPKHSERAIYASHSSDRIVPKGQNVSVCVDEVDLGQFTAVEQAGLRWEVEVLAINTEYSKNEADD